MASEYTFKFRLDRPLADIGDEDPNEVVARMRNTLHEWAGSLLGKTQPDGFPEPVFMAPVHYNGPDEPDIVKDEVQVQATQLVAELWMARSFDE